MLSLPFKEYQSQQAYLCIAIGSTMGSEATREIHKERIKKDEAESFENISRDDLRLRKDVSRSFYLYYKAKSTAVISFRCRPSDSIFARTE
jgi:hypothetical protein